MAAMIRQPINQRAFRRKLLVSSAIVLFVLTSLLFAWHLLLRIPFAGSAPVRISEIMTVNTSVLPDEDGDYHA